MGVEAARRPGWRRQRLRQGGALAWNASEYGGITWLPFLGNSLSAPEDTEIWLPDLQPYNTITGIIDSLDAAVAQVSSDGTVFWSRPGLLDVMCGTLKVSPAI